MLQDDTLYKLTYLRTYLLTSWALRKTKVRNGWRDKSLGVSYKQSLTAPTWRSAQRLFHRWEAVTGKPRSPMVERLVRRMTSDDDDVELRGWGASMLNVAVSY